MAKIKTVHGIKEHKVASEKEWLAARKKLLVEEKKFTKLHDELNLHRASCPGSKSKGNTFFDGPNGKETLADLFCGKSQLIVLSFHVRAGLEGSLRACSFWPTISTA